jgi:hypothetical protein
VGVIGVSPHDYTQSFNGEWFHLLKTPFSKKLLDSKYWIVETCKEGGKKFKRGLKEVKQLKTNKALTGISANIKQILIIPHSLYHFC